MLTSCYGLNYVQNAYVEALTPYCDGIWRCDLWEVIRFRAHEGGA